MMGLVHRSTGTSVSSTPFRGVPAERYTRARPHRTTSPMDIEILIVDDHGLVRDGLRTLLEAQEGLRVVGDARTADEALALARHLQPGVIVLDVQLPDRDGFEICGEIREL